MFENLTLFWIEDCIFRNSMIFFSQKLVMLSFQKRLKTNNIVWRTKQQLNENWNHIDTHKSTIKFFLSNTECVMCACLPASLLPLLSNSNTQISICTTHWLMLFRRALGPWWNENRYIKIAFLLLPCFLCLQWVHKNNFQISRFTVWYWWCLW